MVRVRNTKFGDVGTGIIVKISRGEAYIVTAAHVVRGDARPEVYLFTQQREALRASLIHREDDDQRGLALLGLKADRQTLSGLTALNLGSSSGLEGGEGVTLIGFPDGTSNWTVTSGTVARLEGRNVVFSGSVTDGNSGGPLLLGGQVIGLVTDSGPTLSHAVQAESVALYIRGVEHELADLTPAPTPMPTPAKKSPERIAPTDEFCRALATLVEASKNNFDSIKGERAENHYHATLKMPGARSGYVIGIEEAYFYLLVDEDRRKVETEFNRTVSKLTQCLSDWENKVASNIVYRRHKFREGRDGTVITVRYNLEPQYETYYYLSLIAYPPNNSEW